MIKEYNVAMAFNRKMEGQIIDGWEHCGDPIKLTNSFELPKCGQAMLNSSRHNQIIDSLGHITKISYLHLEMHLLQQNEASK